MMSSRIVLAHRNNSFAFASVLTFAPYFGCSVPCAEVMHATDTNHSLVISLGLTFR